MSIIKKLLNFFQLGRNEAYETYLPTYTAIVKQARTPALYGAGMAPDSFDGRFDMMVLHVYLVLKRLKAEGQGRHGAGQVLFDLFFRDMDQAMREMGVGDLGVGKKVKKMAEAFYGRVHAYDTAFVAKEAAALHVTLERNLYPDGSEILKPKMAEYARALDVYLSAQSCDTVLGGDPFSGFGWQK
ncbi:MAG: ubiquinol-cytochrome C chaperone family protein [Parvibaculales bacterium]